MDDLSFRLGDHGRYVASIRLYPRMIDWTKSTDIQAMLMSLPDGEFQSELRVFAIECASRVLAHLPEPEFASALDMSRKFAMGDCTTEELDLFVDAASALLDPHVDVPTTRDFAGSAVVDASSVHPSNSQKTAGSVTCALQASACAAADAVADNEYDSVYNATVIAESKIQCELLRSQIPNPNARSAT